MKNLKIFMKVVVLILLHTLIGLGGCNYSQPESRSPGDKIISRGGVEFGVIGDNFDFIAKHGKQREDAAAYLRRLESAVKNVAEEKHVSIGSDRAVQHREMVELSNEGEQFGYLFDPLTNCRSAGISVLSYWNTVERQLKLEEAIEAYARYREYAAQCKYEIENVHAPTTSIVGPVSQISPPFPGCLEVINSGASGGEYKQWTCPAASIPGKRILNEQQSEGMSAKSTPFRG